MRYMAQRIRSGEWISRDVRLTDPESVTTLSGPGQLSGTIDPLANAEPWIDGLRPFEEWATMIYECDEDTGQITNHGIVVPSTAYDQQARITCMGVTGYPQGYIYRGNGATASGRTWGPVAAVKASKRGPATAAVARPDPLRIFFDHWAYIQGQTASDLGVRFEGAVSSPRRIGTYAEPYRLRRWEVPDLGSEIDTLAELTPFEFVEDFSWADTAMTKVNRVVRVGQPRLGEDRSVQRPGGPPPLRFAMGENINVPVVVGTVEGFANFLIGVGLGEAGPSMNYDEVALSVDDGRLRRTRVMTDKTASTTTLRARLRWYQQALRQRIDVTSVAVQEHPNAPLAQINLGDDIRILADHPEYGDIDLKVRVLNKQRGDSDTSMVLTTTASAFFVYDRPDEEFA